GGGYPPSSTSAPHLSLRQSLLGKRTREHPPREGRHLRRLPQRRATAAAVHLWEAGSSLPPEGGALECEALRVQDGDGDRGVRWPASAARHRRMGGSRRLRARLGAKTRRMTVADDAEADDPDSAITKPQAQHE